MRSSQFTIAEDPPRNICRNEFPLAPDGRTGWPWDIPESFAPATTEMPLITVVTPSFNQGVFLEETIRSVLLQGYPNLEYIVIDGGSTDESVAIIRKYQPWLTYWVSEPDGGQPNAINKGLRRSHGSLFAFINSDDLFLPGALLTAGLAHAQSPNCLIAGDVLDFREATTLRRVKQTGLTLDNFIRVWNHPEWHQPGVFIPRALFDNTGPFDQSLQYGFDYAFMCRALEYASVQYLDHPVAKFRLHGESKTCANDILILREHLRVAKRFWSLLPSADRTRYRRYAAEHLFWEGLVRLIRRRSRASRLIWEGLCAQPGWALAGAARNLWSWSLLRMRR